MIRIPKIITNSAPFIVYTDFLKRIYFTKKKVNLYVFLLILQKETLRDNLVERSRSMSFSFLLSMFPAILFVFTLIPHIPIPNLQASLMGSINELLPATISASLNDTIFEILNKSNGSVMSLGFILALYSATNGIMAMGEAFNKCYSSADKRSFFKKLSISILIIILLTLIIVLAIGFIVLFQMLLEDYQESQFVFQGIKYIIIFLIFYIGISMIYYLAPALNKRWNFFSHGSFIATVLIVLVTVLFSYYVNNFNSYNKIYGSIGALIGAMIWFNIVSFLLLIGFEINACIEMAEIEYYQRKVLSSKKL